MSDFLRAPQPVPAAELDSALEAVLLRVRLRARRRAAWLGHLLGEGSPASNGSAGMASQRELARLLDDRDDPAAEADWIADQTDLNAPIEAVEAVISADTDSRLATLCRVFALDDIDTDILHLCVAAALDPAMGRLFAYLHDNAARPHASLHLVARLFGWGRFASMSDPLRRWEIVRLHDSEMLGDQLAPLQLDPVIRDWLAGTDDLDPHLTGRARLIAPLTSLPEWDVAGAADFALRQLADQPGRTVVIHVIAPPRSGRKTFAAGVAAQLGMPLLAVDMTDPQAGETVFIHAQRHAFLHRCALAWQGSPPRWTEKIGHFPVQFVIREDVDSIEGPRGAAEYHAVLPAPSSETRWQLWRAYAPGTAAADPEALGRLAMRASARPGHIAAVTRSSDAASSADVLERGLRTLQRHQLGDLAQALDCSFRWDDLVVSESLRDQLRDYVYEARDRAALWERHAEARRLFPQGRGLAALFSGPPGTGKTMAAQVIAAELGLDLFRIDLSTVVSKYVGETAHNLQKILSRAKDMDAVLFFDEADALYARRTEVKDAHDRYANTDTNHLLQAIEQYDGIAILATNRKSAIDPAFLRRLRYVMEFSKPDANQRWEIWLRMIGALAGEDSLSSVQPVIERFAVELELTGAQIKFAVLSALFTARREGRPLNADHLLRGLDRELSKEGRALNDREKARLQ